VEANVLVQDSEGNQFQILNSSSSAPTGFFSLPASNAINSTWQIVKTYTVSLSSGGYSFSPTTIVVISIQWLVALTVGPGKSDRHPHPFFFFDETSQILFSSSSDCTVVSILGLVSVGVWGYKKRSVDRRKQSLARLLDEQEDQLDTIHQPVGNQSERVGRS
jgi:hypothetical protein